MKILITGANGYLGAKLAEYLAKQGHSIIALVHHMPISNPCWIEQMDQIIEGDVTDMNWAECFISMDVEAVIHTVSLDHKASQDNPTHNVYSVNVQATHDILNNLCEKGDIRFIYLSTQQVYGRFVGDVLDDNSIPAPINMYGLTHLLSEEICNYFNRHTNESLISVRLSNSYGSPIFKNNNCWWLVINDFCRTAMESGEIIIQSDGTPQRDFIHISDVCRGIEQLLATDHDKLIHPSYNLGSGVTHTIGELAVKVAQVYEEVFSKKLPIYFSDRAPYDSKNSQSKKPRFSYRIGKLQQLGFQPEIEIKAGISEMLQYLEKSSHE